MTLIDLEKGEHGIVYSLKHNDFLLKLVEMGFYEGRMVSIEEYTSDKETFCVSVSDSKIMLRKVEADSIMVQKCDIKAKLMNH